MMKFEIRNKLETQKKSRQWYRTHAGKFANDKVFEQIVELGAKYRKSLRPG